MVFSSPIFLFLFLPVVLGAYYLVPAKYKNVLLLLASLFFYSWGEGKIVLIMLLVTGINFWSGLIIRSGRRRAGLLISVATSITALWLFKYFNFTFHNFSSFLQFTGIKSDAFASLPHIALPIGISFYTFQALSYTIDVYRGHVQASRSFVDFATYVTMFPQLIAGPIVRYADIHRQLRNKHISIDNFSAGVERFIIGLAKKVLIANTFAAVADEIFYQNLANLSTFYAWLGVIAYAFQIYYDFSGYSDMAIGLGKMLGFDFMENFNYPYIATSIQEFWRRWHISLSTWFRDYLYIPLGGNKVPKLRVYLNLAIVFLVTGLWHGASWHFVAWGLFHGLFIVIEKIGFGKILQLLWRPLRHIYTLLVVLIGWVFFRAESLSGALLYLKRMFVFSGGDPALSSYLDFFFLDSRTLFFTIVALVFAVPPQVYFPGKMAVPRAGLVRQVYFIALLVLSLIYVGAGTYNPFIYFRF